MTLYRYDCLQENNGMSPEAKVALLLKDPERNKEHQLNDHIVCGLCDESVAFRRLEYGHYRYDITKWIAHKVLCEKIQ